MKFTPGELAALRKTVKTRYGCVAESEIISEYKSGVSINRLSTRHRLSENRVKRILERNAVRIRNKSEAAKVWAA